jgi:hypothetical protein
MLYTLSSLRRRVCDYLVVGGYPVRNEGSWKRVEEFIIVGLRLGARSF